MRRTGRALPGTSTLPSVTFPPSSAGPDA